MTGQKRQWDGPGWPTTAIFQKPGQDSVKRTRISGSVSLANPLFKIIRSDYKRTVLNYPLV